LKTLGGTVMTVQRADVASTEVSPLCMMPEGLLSVLHEPDVRDLFLYLRQKQTGADVITAVNAKRLLQRHRPHQLASVQSAAWRVENGEIDWKGGATPRVAS
jgi:hypothetical protein